MRSKYPLATAVCLSLLAASSVAAADPDPNQAVKDETARLQAEAALATAKADLMKAEASKITALGLPSFEGKTTLNGDKAGVMEVNLLAAAALGSAAKTIAANISSPTVLLAGDEVLDLAAPESLWVQMDYIARLYELAEINVPNFESSVAEDDESGGSAAVAVAAMSAFAGLLRSETTITGADAASASDRLLASAVAGSLKAKHAILPGAVMAGATARGKKLYDRLEDLAKARTAAQQRKAALPDISKANRKQKAELERLGSAMTMHDAFLAKVLAPDASGAVPFVTAARLSGLASVGSITRVYVNKAGGSIVNTKNIATTFGLDPLKLSGGVIVSFVQSNPDTGEVSSAGVYSCDTGLASVRKIQERRWKPTTKADLCITLVKQAS